MLVEAMKKEILYDDGFIDSRELIDSIYFGGGTPSLLNATELNTLVETIHKKFNVSQEAEITLEANPDDINIRQIKEWMHAGINRISLGVQSFQDAELRWMNRSHDASQSMKSIELLQSAGLENISADLIFGSPLSDETMLKKNVTILLDKQIQHLSCYALTVEEKTALHHQIQKQISPSPDNEMQAKHFLLLHEWLTETGFEHYEISNYAIPGYRSLHNSNYWKGIPYFGFGPSAHGFNGKRTRRWNLSNNALYISQWESNSPSYEEELLTDTQEMNEFIMTSLRTMEGIDMMEFRQRFGPLKASALIKDCGRFIAEHKLTHQNERLFLTVNGMLYADGIAAELFDLS